MKQQPDESTDLQTQPTIQKKKTLDKVVEKMINKFSAVYTTINIKIPFLYIDFNRKKKRHTELTV